MKIALDFDSVLSDTMIRWVENYNSKFQKSITKHEHITKWEFWDDLGISKDTALEIFNEVWSEWRKLPATEENLKENVKELTKLGTVDIVTDIKEEYITNVEMWLKEKEIPHNELKPAQGKKAELDYHYFIDDNPIFAIESSSNGKNCLLYDQPWNHDIQGEKITRINKLNDAFEIIKNKDI